MATDISQWLRGLELGSGLSGQALLDDLASTLQDELDGTPNLGGATVAYDNESIVIPSIAIGDGTSFVATLTMPDANSVRLTVSGDSGLTSASAARSRVAVTVRRPGSLALSRTINAWCGALAKTSRTYSTPSTR